MIYHCFFFFFEWYDISLITRQTIIRGLIFIGPKWFSCKKNIWNDFHLFFCLTTVAVSWRFTRTYQQADTWACEAAIQSKFLPPGRHVMLCMQVMWCSGSKSLYIIIMHSGLVVRYVCKKGKVIDWWWRWWGQLVLVFRRHLWLVYQDNLSLNQWGGRVYEGVECLERVRRSMSGAKWCGLFPSAHRQACLSQRTKTGEWLACYTMLLILGCSSFVYMFFGARKWNPLFSYMMWSFLSL